MRTDLCILLTAFLVSLTGCHEFNKVLLRDDFSGLDSGLFSAPVGPHTEYHYLHEAGPKGNWVVTCFRPGSDWGTAWQVKKEESTNIMCQTLLNKSDHSSHPMIISGDSLWRDYTLKVRFRTYDVSQFSGVAFRYRNDRCFYFFGVKDSLVYLSLFKDGINFNTLNETILAEKLFVIVPGQDLLACITVQGNSIRAKLNNNIGLEVIDDTYPVGKIGLISNARAQYKSVEVLTSSNEMKNYENKKAEYELEARKLQAANPAMVVWKKIITKGFGIGRNLRFGDLNGDEQIDVLIGQVVHHDWPSDSHSELSCLTAMTFDNKILWQIGKPDPEKNHLTNDVGFQIHDIDHDGKNEVIYCMNSEIVVANAATGKTIFKVITPDSKKKNDKFPRILGDCLFFFDCEGKGFDGDMLIKDRYSNFWIMNNKLKIIWEGSCKTGHYPYASDIDNDGKDELAIGYSLYDHNGKLLWCLDNKIEDHADGVAIVDFDGNPQREPEILYAASDAGFLKVGIKGNILKRYFIGHVQNPAIANFRSDKTGLETITVNFWGNQGIIHFFDSAGNIYHEFEPNQFGSMCLPLNWTGKDEEFFVHNSNIKEGGVFDGWGRKVLIFPDDGHPDMCNAVLDIIGDCRDEIVVWNPDELWVYTQSDNPKSGKLYKPVRNPLYNYSNYQATVSLPGWNQ